MTAWWPGGHEEGSLIGSGPSCNGPYHGGVHTLLFGQGASIGYLVKSDRLVPLNAATNAILRPVKFPALIAVSEAVHR
jgi:hypothetical protein